MNKKCYNEKNNLLKLSDFLRIISEPNRLKIICMLSKSKLCVCEITTKLDLAQNLISHHLKILKDAKLVFSTKNGLKVIYSLNSKKITNYNNLLQKIISQKENYEN